jgi:hypothetical protein
MLRKPYKDLGWWYSGFVFRNIARKLYLKLATA